MNDEQAIIETLNADLRGEHASVIRYLMHAYQSGEDTPLGSMLLSMAREEMWHMDWLADAGFSPGSGHRLPATGGDGPALPGVGQPGAAHQASWSDLRARIKHGGLASSM